MVESCKIIKQAMDGLPAGKYAADIRKIKPAVGEAYTAIENPRGELGFYIVSDGTGVAYRARTRPPSFIHFAIFPHLMVGHQLSDVVAVLGSLNIIAAELDR
jgi:NADH-quinone oxidoreductase subunit D